ncbi:MAG: prephenate dehydrogenase [Chloroflexi bacterium]|nr:prephenate dehydrogenase [Chloroflexota bacterium]
MHVTVAIIGLDRLGTSFGLALKRYQSQPKAQHSFTIIGSDPTAFPMKTAQKMGAIDNFNRAVLKAMDGADLIILNVPYGSLEDTYAVIGPELKSGAVVLDTSLLKQPAIDLAQRYFPARADGQPLAYLIGTTPIINVQALYGGDLSVEGARADLFDKSDVLLTPDMKTPSEAIQLAEDIVRLIGGQPRFMDPAEHDGLIAATEELPALLGATLFYTLLQSEGWQELRRMVNPALALATQNLRYQMPDDLLPLLVQNRENLLRHLEALIGALDGVRDALAENDSDQIEAFLVLVRRTWEQWDVKRFSGKWEDSGQQPEVLPGPFGSVSGFLSMRRKKEDEDDED